ncbi:MAG: hypothetical protein PW788_14490 [Micavibrio sp.]|nr:hypothetical protein [Micavibrio sp.]
MQAIMTFRKFILLLALLAFLLPVPSFGLESMDMAMPHHAKESGQKAVANTIKLELIPAGNLGAGKSTKVMAKLSRIADGSPVRLRDLKVAHTKKLHLLIVDPSLTDYHHIHPMAGKRPGEFVFDFVPLKNDSYRIWADIVPVATGKQEFVTADMGNAAKRKAEVDKQVSTRALVQGYDFKLTLENEPKAGEAVMGAILVSDKAGSPFTQLEPVMGAFAHVVGFEDDYATIMHIHPMGKEPQNDKERGGPELKFHLEPKSAGFIKLFAQVRINGKDIFVPFGIVVK